MEIKDIHIDDILFHAQETIVQRVQIVAIQKDTEHKLITVMGPMDGPSRHEFWTDRFELFPLKELAILHRCKELRKRFKKLEEEQDEINFTIETLLGDAGYSPEDPEVAEIYA